MTDDYHETEHDYRERLALFLAARIAFKNGIFDAYHSIVQRVQQVGRGEASSSRRDRILRLVRDMTKEDCLRAAERVFVEEDEK